MLERVRISSISDGVVGFQGLTEVVVVGGMRLSRVGQRHDCCPDLDNLPRTDGRQRANKTEQAGWT